MLRRTLLIGATTAALMGLTGIAAPARAETYEMVMTNEIATTHWTAQAMEHFAGRLKERSGGRIMPKIYHAGTLLKDKEAVAALGTGAVHMVWPVSVQLESLSPQYGVINLPFMITDEVMLKPGASDEIATLMTKYVEDIGIEVLGLMRTADLMFLAKDKEIDTPKDLSGMKIRLTGGRVLQDTMRRFGANPVTMPATEMAAALMQGAIDGIYTSAGGWEMVGTTAKVASYVPGMSLLTYSVLVDKNWLADLPDDLRQVVKDTTKEMLSRQWQEAIDSDKHVLDKMLAAGGKLSTVDDAAREQFQELSRKASSTFSDRYPEVTQQMEAIKAKYSAN